MTECCVSRFGHSGTYTDFDTCNDWRSQFRAGARQGQPCLPHLSTPMILPAQARRLQGSCQQKRHATLSTYQTSWAGTFDVKADGHMPHAPYRNCQNHRKQPVSLCLLFNFQLDTVLISHASGKQDHVNHFRLSFQHSNPRRMFTLPTSDLFPFSLPFLDFFVGVPLQVVLQAAFEATLTVASCLAARRGTRIKERDGKRDGTGRHGTARDDHILPYHALQVFLTALGAGSLSNRVTWIAGAVTRLFF